MNEYYSHMDCNDEYENMDCYDEYIHIWSVCMDCIYIK